MAEQTKVTVLAVMEVTDEEAGQPDADGIVSSRIIPYAELDDETLEMLFEQSPEFVFEKRPDWVKQHYPHWTH